ncbi:WW domain-containing adapter protein with coiled-coil-like [Actinia tenebrosa]|uniref:WW domain-containing adapter protein with coiled-coil-like n=1 Tax=Actinia tenebrosa TaxID=6105 RepID=A0A6P8HT51_ACTTE|nr:WW domain-containing adapter protein with coiled-coil-like [Actinia tenebrosa]
MSNRKYPRLSDGYNERSPYHPYQNKKQANCIADRDRSPAGSNSRDNSPYSSSNRHSNLSPRSQRSKSTYSRSKDGSRKGSNQSPNDSHRGSNSHSTERHTKFNHISTDEGFPWSQHVSSSGKCYYYNFKTEKSQWEKPKEWIERERRERENKEKDQNAIGAKEARDGGFHKEDSNHETSRMHGSKFSLKESLSNENRDGSRAHIEDRGRENIKAVDGDRGQGVIKTMSAHTSAIPTTSQRSTPVAASLSGNSVASPAGSLQDVSPPSTPSSRASMFESSSHSSSPQLVSLSPHGFQTSQSPLQLNIRHGVSQPNVTQQQYAKQQYSTQHNLTQYGLVNNGNPQNISSSLPTSQAQKSYDLEMNKRPALHPLQQATLLQQRKLTEIRNHGITNYQQTFPMITQPLTSASALVKENNRIHKSPGSPVIFSQSLGTNSPALKEQFQPTKIQTSFASTLSSQAQLSPSSVSPVSVQPTPSVNLQLLSKYADKNLTNHINNLQSEGLDKQIQRLNDEGCSNVGDANKNLIQQLQLRSQMDLLEMHIDIGTKRITSMKEVTKTLEILLAESDKKPLT